MHCTKKITDDLIWVGANDRRLAMFEGVYSVPRGVSYNSYLLIDEKITLFDTVDKAVQQRFLENLKHALGDRQPDYLIVQHMEPDHSAAFAELICRYPDMEIVCNSKTLGFIKQFFELDIEDRVKLVGEGDTLNTGKHTLHFIMAPMVHWPEVMVIYDSADKTLFSADAFGCFGALNGAVFADEVDFERDYMDELRRYYANIVGKYGSQVQWLLDKIAAFEIRMICPLHGFVWRKDIHSIFTKYDLWSSYIPEEKGVMIAYASIYSNTENAAEILSSRLRDKGVKTVMFDVSVTPASEIVSAAFKWSHLVFASTTYNAGIFVTMEALLHDLTYHNIQNRTVAIIENGSWAATSGGLIRESFAKCKNINFIDDILTINSTVKENQLSEIDAMADALASTLGLGTSAETSQTAGGSDKKGTIDNSTMFKLSYGLFVLSAKSGGKDNGCIINTVTQITQDPLQIAVAVNNQNLTHDMIKESGLFNVSVLTQSVPFTMFKHFGFQSGKTADKFADYDEKDKTSNGLFYLSEFTNAVMSAKVSQTIEFETHSVFIADITEAIALSNEPSVTYQYYFDHIKPKPEVRKTDKKGFICKICAYVYEGDSLPEDYICPLCKHGVEDFDPL